MNQNTTLNKLKAFFYNELHLNFFDGATVEHDVRFFPDLYVVGDDSLPNSSFVCLMKSSCLRCLKCIITLQEGNRKRVKNQA